VHKEDVYAIVIFASIGLAIPAVVVLRHFLGIDIVPFIKPTSVRTVFGVLLALAAALVCVLNVYLSHLSPWLYRREHGSLEGYGSMSGLPMVGGLFTLGAGALLPESAALGVFLLALYALDTGGMPWFFIQTLHHGA
jgi:hypothetical protein